MIHTRSKYRIIFIGTPEFAVPSLKKLIENKLSPIAIITQEDKKVGRKQKIVFSPIKQVALKYDIPVLQPKSIKNIEVEKHIKNLRPDIIIVAAYGQIIPQKILDIPKFGCVNIHASLLPKYRGASPIQYAILNGDNETGVTLMQMNEKMDEGNIIAQKKIKIIESYTTLTLSDQLSKLGAELLIETLPRIFKKEIKLIPQDQKKATYTKILQKDDGKINWEKSATEIELQIRAFSPWPGTYTNFQFSIFNFQKRLKIIQAEAQASRPKSKPGTIFLTLDKKLAVACGKGSLILKKVQVEGKKEISGEEFIRGYFYILNNHFL
jgi:methionyl-tRNA formyltransferase